MQPHILTNNSLQNLGTATLTRPNMVGNLSVEHPTVEQMNEAISQGQNGSLQRDRGEPAFGVHIRQAADVIRRMVR